MDAKPDRYRRSGAASAYSGTLGGVAQVYHLVVGELSGRGVLKHTWHCMTSLDTMCCGVEAARSSVSVLERVGTVVAAPLLRPADGRDKV